MTERMDRLQFYLEPELNKELDRLSKDLKVSKAQLIREGVRKLVYEEYDEAKRPGLDIIGLIAAPPVHGATAKDHDQVIYEVEKKGRKE